MIGKLFLEENLKTKSATQEPIHIKVGTMPMSLYLLYSLLFPVVETVDVKEQTSIVEEEWEELSETLLLRVLYR